MNYHNITKCDMNNGNGLRVVLWVSGCSHNCQGCHNPQTHDPNGGIRFDDAAKKELFEALTEDYHEGITFSGGDPLHEANRSEVLSLIKEIREKFPDKTIWLYSGYTWENLPDDARKIVELCDVFCDGRFVESLKNVNFHWVGSTNQRVIDVRKSIKAGKVILLEGGSND